MITKVIISNFKKFKVAEIELGDRAVFIGPNNAGKTTCLQALALWHFGLISWVTKKSGKNINKRSGVAINRKDLIHIPIPESILLWKDKHVRKSPIIDGKQQNENVRILIEVEGTNNGIYWKQGLEFDYANSESIYCRPVGDLNLKNETLKLLIETKVAFLQPMSGLATVEPKFELGRINVLLGEGQTAQVLRNLCYHIFINLPQKWVELNGQIERLFGSHLLDPVYNTARGEITLTFSDGDNDIEFDLSSSGRGFQQTLLLLSYLFSNPNSVLLLDEPDAHLEILRQRQIYQVLSDIAQKQQSQIIIASHSEVILNEAADQDIVIAFVGKPHRIDDRGKSQVLKSLKEIGFDQYYLAEQVGWILYLEGSTDLAILRKIAQKLNHKASKCLERPFVHYVLNQPSLAEKHFFGLKEAKKDLVGVAIYDRLSSTPNSSDIKQVCWKKRELENYFMNYDVLLRYAKDGLSNDLFGSKEAERREKAMVESVNEITAALKTLKLPNPWSDDIKITDDFLDKVFETYFEKLGIPNLLRKTDYHSLVDFYNIQDIDNEVIEKLDLIVEVAGNAKSERG